MLFDTLEYWAFFAVVILCVAKLRPAGARLFLVAASFVFYSFWDWRFVFLLGGSTIFNYLSGRILQSSPEGSKKRVLTVAVMVNLMLLGFFKYYNFFVLSFASLFGPDPANALLNIVLPVGISFFTFEGIAYNADIYRGEVKARESFIDFALFLSFFPHLVAGPIIRPRDFFPQVGPRWSLTRADFNWGLWQISKGLIKKTIIADTIGKYADNYFNSPSAYGAAAGVLAFGLQIYFDFAGYTDIARGCARLLGYRFPPNFERPYLSCNISDFWRRWHISLSSWLRDYLYIPLGGNRHGKAATYRNYLLVMSLGGLWHGASWNFFAWGFYHGVLLASHRAWLDYGPPRLLAVMKSKVGSASAWLVTTVLVFAGWIPFRAKDFSTTKEVLLQLTTRQGWSIAAVPAAVLICLATSLIWCWIDKGRRVERWIENQASSYSVAAMTGVLLWLMELLIRRDSAIPFIYFRF